MDSCSSSTTRKQLKRNLKRNIEGKISVIKIEKTTVPVCKNE
jgi:hypothetical protein